MRKARRLLVPSLILTLMLIFGVWSISAGTPAGGVAQPLGPDPDAEKVTLAELALKKMDPKLREKARLGGSETLYIRIDASRTVDINRYAVKAVSRTSPLLGQTLILAEVKANALSKIGSTFGVMRMTLLDFEPANIPRRDPDFSGRASLETRRARLAALERGASLDKTDDSAKINDWFEGGPTHTFQNAWAKGYTGKGVKVAILDSGTDQAHPDLIGTWAVVTDTTSPHAGWPMAFDPFSMLLYAFDANFGTTFVRTGSAFYVDTRTRPQVTQTDEERQMGQGHFTFAPFAHSEGRGGKTPGPAHTYKLRMTSKSGVIRVGSHPDRYLSEVYNQHVAVLLVDERTPAVYDTVYVDLNNNYDFTDENPVTRDSPAAYHDKNGDDIADLSGGIVYFIANGRAKIPATDWYYEDLAPAPPNGSLVAFMGDFDPELGNHGTLTASHITARGRINTHVPQFSDLPGDGRPPGAVIGAAPDARTVSVGDIYFGFESSTQDAYILCMLGYDGEPNTADDIQITSNSYGNSDQDNDGWDYTTRYIDRYSRGFNTTTAFLFSTGNGGPGYGTTAPPSPSVGVMVGASTQFGSTGWDSITRTTQIVAGEAEAFSNRGPGARGEVGVDIMANGARGAGDLGLNAALDGRLAWETWGGTSRSTPVAAGGMALIYQAFRQAHGRWPTQAEGREIIKAGALSTGYDAFTQGAGRLNVDRSVDIAAGRHGVHATPDSWRVGDYRGDEFPGFANIIQAGEADAETFSLHNPSDHPISVNLSAKTLRRISSREFSFTTKPQDQEGPYNFHVPDYLIPVQDIPANAELMTVSAIFPLEQLDPNRDYTEDQRWYLYLYDWTDINGDGKLWDDRDNDGIVDHATTNPPQAHNIDFFHNDDPPDVAEPDWALTEIQRWEYTRVMYNRPYATALRVNMQNPAQAKHDGLFIGLQHRLHTAEVPTTTFQIRIDYYAKSDWNWVTFGANTVNIPARSSVNATASVQIPANTPPGMYQGFIYATYQGRAPFNVFMPTVVRNSNANFSDTGNPPAVAQPPRPPDWQLTIPVVAAVAATYDYSGTVTFGGSRANDADAPYNNGAVRGLFDWSWRDESGDWRFFYVDMQGAPPAGTRLVTRTRWNDPGPPTDIDTIILGPASDRFSDPNHPDNDTLNLALPTFFGPYTLDTVNKSPNKNIGDGKWQFDTATGGPEDWVAGPVREGLHQLLLHNVLYAGRQHEAQFEVTLGAMRVQPASVSITRQITTTTTLSECLPLTFRSTLDLPGLASDGFGLSKIERLTGLSAQQDDPNDENTSSYKRTITVSHASKLVVNMTSASQADLDLFLLYDANRDGRFDFPAEVVSRSEDSASTELVSAGRPQDGVYQVWVHGYDVPGGSATFNLNIDLVQGQDIAVHNVPSGAITANTTVNLQMCYRKEVAPGDTYAGEVRLGPSTAPGVLSVPFSITATRP